MSAQIDVTTLGEALVVMDPLARGPLRHVDTFAKRVGGAELNVAVALSRLGHRAGWAGRLGDDEFGREILTFLRGEGVDISDVLLDSGAPTGLYFKERRALDRLRAYYYRAGSAASHHRYEDLDVDYLLSGEILHLTGITPALSENCREMTERLIEAAVERGTFVSFDANVRWLLFDSRDPHEVLGPLLARADLVFLADEEANHLLGSSDPETVQQAREAMRAETVVVHSAEEAFAANSSGLTLESSYPVSVIDTVGAGDAFVAGFLSARLRGWDTGECLRMANACGACAVTVPGDVASMPSEEEALGLLYDRRGTER